MVEALISDWLEEYSTITEDELTSFAAQHQHNHEVAAALFAVFHNYTKYLEVYTYLNIILSNVCHT